MALPFLLPLQAWRGCCNGCPQLLPSTATMPALSQAEFVIKVPPPPSILYIVTMALPVLLPLQAWRLLWRAPAPRC